MQTTASYQNIHKHKILPGDFFGWMLLLFILATGIPFFGNQLKMLGVLMAGCYILFFLKEKKWLQMEFIIYFYWLVWSLTGYAVSVDKESFLKSFLLVLQIWVMGITIAGITAHRGDLGVNFLALFIGGIILLLISTISGELSMGMDTGAKVRVKGTTSNSNLYSYILLITVTALLYFWGNNVSWKRRIVMIMLLVFFASGIIFSGSRKAFMGLVLLIYLWLWLCYRRELLKRPSFFIGFIFAIGSLYLSTDYMLSNTLMGERFKADLVEKQDQIGEQNRVILYREGFKIIRENPVFGVGLGNFKLLSSLGVESHSDYVEVLVSTGIIGFLLYFSIYVLLWRRLMRIQKRIKDPSILYNIGLFKAIIITMLILALGRPNFTSQITWIVLSSAIGYTWSLERKLTYPKMAQNI